MRILARVAEAMITGYKLERGVPKPGSGFKMKSQGLKRSRLGHRAAKWSGEDRMTRKMWSGQGARVKGQDVGGVTQEIPMGQIKGFMVRVNERLTK